VPGAAVLIEKLLHPVTRRAAAESNRSIAVAKNVALRRRKRQNTNPKKRLKGRRRPASENFEEFGWVFMAELPPLNGLLVSMVS
jgi:hypothetical protein